jgi:2,4-dichlorophenol 6-monooxygenase
MALIDSTGDVSRRSSTDSKHSLQYGKFPESTTVLIVGGGPVGITSAIAFARYGMECVILERHATRLGQPKAHVINYRSVEIFRQYGVDLAPLRELGLSDAEGGAVIFASSMNSLEYGVVETGAGRAAAREASPETMFNVAQPLVEEHLLQAALKTGKVTYLRMHEWQHCTEDSTTKEITSTVLLRETNATRSITSKYLIACDGANARSRDVLQIPFETLNGGPEVVLHYASVHYSADLSHFKPGLLWFILNPTGMGVFIAYNRKNSWVFTIQYDPSVIPTTTFTSEFLKEQVFKVGTKCTILLLMRSNKQSGDRRVTR